MENVIIVESSWEKFKRILLEFLESVIDAVKVIFTIAVVIVVFLLQVFLAMIPVALIVLLVMFLLGAL